MWTLVPLTEKRKVGAKLKKFVFGMCEVWDAFQSPSLNVCSCMLNLNSQRSQARDLPWGVPAILMVLNAMGLDKTSLEKRGPKITS